MGTRQPGLVYTPERVTQSGPSQLRHTGSSGKVSEKLTSDQVEAKSKKPSSLFPPPDRITHVRSSHHYLQKKLAEHQTQRKLQRKSRQASGWLLLPFDGAYEGAAAGGHLQPRVTGPSVRGGRSVSAWGEQPPHSPDTSCLNSTSVSKPRLGLQPEKKDSTKSQVSRFMKGKQCRVSE